jgi:formylglycine-generating enzyme required for sulfatase activity
LVLDGSLPSRKEPTHVVASHLDCVLRRGRRCDRQPHLRSGAEGEGRPAGDEIRATAEATFHMGWYGEKSSTTKTQIKEDFEIAIHTVTQGQWQELMGNNPSFYSRQGNRLGSGGKDKVKEITDAELRQFPVESVSWEDAQGFLEKLNDKEKGKGWMYRLPSSAEWEYACRGGATSEQECSYNFYFAKPTNDLSSKEANFDGNSPFGRADKGPRLNRTTKVGSYAPNKLGLYDMHGNVWQWCDDVDDQKAPRRVLRGGAFSFGASDCRAAVQRASTPPPNFRLDDTGFRLVRVPVR